MQAVQAFKTFDGMLFTDERAANAYEKTLKTQRLLYNMFGEDVPAAYLDIIAKGLSDGYAIVSDEDDSSFGGTE
jgi:hypothetical protein